MEKRDKASKNFTLDWKIETMSQLDFALENYKSIFWRFRVFPTAFLIGWQYRKLRNEMIAGRLWVAKRNDADK